MQRANFNGRRAFNPNLSSARAKARFCFLRDRPLMSTAESQRKIGCSCHKFSEGKAVGSDYGSKFCCWLERELKRVSRATFPTIDRYLESKKEREIAFFGDRISVKIALDRSIDVRACAARKDLGFFGSRKLAVGKATSNRFRCVRSVPRRKVIKGKREYIDGKKPHA